MNCFGTETNPDQVWTRGALWAMSLKLNDKLENEMGGGKRSIFFCWEKEKNP